MIKRSAVIVSGLILLGACSILGRSTYDSARARVDEDRKPYWRNSTEEAMNSAIKKGPVPWVYSAMWTALDQTGLKDVRQHMTDVMTPENISIYRDVNLRTEVVRATQLWLRKQIVSGASDTRYSFNYANWLWRDKEASDRTKLDAVAMVLHGQLAVAIDGARCRDGSYALNLIASIGRAPDFVELHNYANELGERGRMGLMLDAVAIEELAGERVFQSWLCKPNPAAKDTPVQEGEGVESGAVADGAAVAKQPRMLDDETWRAQRADLIENMLRSVARTEG